MRWCNAVVCFRVLQVCVLFLVCIAGDAVPGCVWCVGEPITCRLQQCNVVAPWLPLAAWFSRSTRSYYEPVCLALCPAATAAAAAVECEACMCQEQREQYVVLRGLLSSREEVVSMAWLFLVTTAFLALTWSADPVRGAPCTSSYLALAWHTCLKVAAGYRAAGVDPVLQVGQHAVSKGAGPSCWVSAAAGLVPLYCSK